MNELIGKKVQWVHQSKRGRVISLTRKTGVIESLDGEIAKIRTSPKAKRLVSVSLHHLHGMDDNPLSEFVTAMADAARGNTPKDKQGVWLRLLDACVKLWDELKNELGSIEVHPGFPFDDSSPCTVYFLGRISVCNTLTEGIARCEQLMIEEYPDIHAAIAAASNQPASDRHSNEIEWKQDGDMWFAPFLSVSEWSDAYEWGVEIRDMPVEWGMEDTLDRAKQTAEETLRKIYAEIGKVLG